MKKKLLCLVLCLAMVMSTLLTGCGSSKPTSGDATDGDSSNEASGDSYADKKVLRVGMECAYAPFNWTQDEDKAANGDEAEKIYGSDYYAYGYDVMVAKKLAEQLGWDVEIHKVEWTSIGLALDAGDYDCIIGGMGYTEEREKTYDFTSAY